MRVGVIGMVAETRETFRSQSAGFQMSVTLSIRDACCCYKEHLPLSSMSLRS